VLASTRPPPSSRAGNHGRVAPGITTSGNDGTGRRYAGWVRVQQINAVGAETREGFLGVMLTLDVRSVVQIASELDVARPRGEDAYRSISFVADQHLIGRELPREPNGLASIRHEDLGGSGHVSGVPGPRYAIYEWHMAPRAQYVRLPRLLSGSSGS
jgi:hypothetical protein